MYAQRNALCNSFFIMTSQYDRVWCSKTRATIWSYELSIEKNKQ